MLAEFLSEIKIQKPKSVYRRDVYIVW